MRKRRHGFRFRYIVLFGYWYTQDCFYFCRQNTTKHHLRHSEVRSCARFGITICALPAGLEGSLSSFRRAVSKDSALDTSVDVEQFVNIELSLAE